MKGFLDSAKEVAAWQNVLIHWFRMNGKEYPWRKTKDPYEILVSELMLQQTQIRSVLERNFFGKWLEKFPDIETLAKAEIDQVLKAWEGLGYYNRARNLHKAANFIVDQLDGVFPSTLEEIKKLPGVGPYTAGAVYSFAFDLPAPIVDGNVVRVFARVFNYQDPVDTTPAQKELWETAGRLTPQTHPREYNSAIMELGQQICAKGNPKCHLCPVSQWCLSLDDPAAANLPTKRKRVKITKKTEEVVLFINDGKVLLTQEAGSQRTGLWRLPLLMEVDSDHLEQIAELTYPITRYQVNMKIFGNPDCKKSYRISKNYNGRWYDLENELPALGAPYLRAIEAVIQSKDVDL